MSINIFYSNHRYHDNQNNHLEWFSLFGNDIHGGVGGHDTIRVRALFGANWVQTAGWGDKTMSAWVIAGYNFLRYDSQSHYCAHRSHRVDINAFNLFGYNEMQSIGAFNTSISGISIFGGNGATVYQGSASITLITLFGSNRAEHVSWWGGNVSGDQVLINFLGANEASQVFSGVGKQTLLAVAGVNKAWRQGWDGSQEQHLVNVFGYNEGIVHLRTGDSWQSATNVFGANYLYRGGIDTNGKSATHVLNMVAGSNVSHMRLDRGTSDQVLLNMAGYNEAYRMSHGESTVKQSLVTIFGMNRAEVIQNGSGGSSNQFLMNMAGANLAIADRNGSKGSHLQHLVNGLGSNVGTVSNSNGDSYQTATSAAGANYLFRGGSDTNGKSATHVLTTLLGSNVSHMRLDSGKSAQHLQNGIGYNETYRTSQHGKSDTEQSLINVLGLNRAEAFQHGSHGSVSQTLISGAGINLATVESRSNRDAHVTQVLVNLLGWNKAELTGGSGATQIGFTLAGGNELHARGTHGSVVQVGVALLGGVNILTYSHHGFQPANKGASTVQIALGIFSANVLFADYGTNNSGTTIVQVAISFAGVNVMTAINNGTVVQVGLSGVSANVMIATGAGTKVQVAFALMGVNALITNDASLSVQVGLTIAGVNVLLALNSGDSVQVGLAAFTGANVLIKSGAGLNVQANFAMLGLAANIGYELDKDANIQIALAPIGAAANVGVGGAMSTNVQVAMTAAGPGVNVAVLDAVTNVQFSLAVMGVAANVMIGDTSVNVQLSSAMTGVAVNVMVGDADVSVMVAVLPPVDGGTGFVGAGTSINVSVGDAGVQVMFAMAAYGVSANVSIGNKDVAVSLAWIMVGANVLVNVGSTDVNVGIAMGKTGANLVVAVGVETVNVMVLAIFQGVNVAVVVGSDLDVNVMIAGGKHVANVLTATDASINVMVGFGMNAVNIMTNVDWEKETRSGSPVMTPLVKSGVSVKLKSQTDADAAINRSNADILTNRMSNEDKNRLGDRAKYSDSVKALDADKIIGETKKESAEGVANTLGKDAAKTKDTGDYMKTLGEVMDTVKESALPALKDAFLGQFSSVTEGAAEGDAGQVLKGLFIDPLIKTGEKILSNMENLNPVAKVKEVEDMVEKAKSTVRTMDKVFNGTPEEVIAELMGMGEEGNNKEESAAGQIAEVRASERQIDAMKLAMQAASSDGDSTKFSKTASSISSGKAVGGDDVSDKMLQQGLLDQQLLSNNTSSKSLDVVNGLISSEALSMDSMMDDAEAGQQHQQQTKSGLDADKSKAEADAANTNNRNAPTNAADQHRRTAKTQEDIGREWADGASTKRDAILKEVKPLNNLAGAVSNVQSVDASNTAAQLTGVDADSYPGARINVMAGGSLKDGVNIMTNVANHGVNVMVATTGLKKASKGALGDAQDEEGSSNKDEFGIRGETDPDTNKVSYKDSDAGVGLNILTNVHTARESYSGKDVNVMAVVTGGMSLNILTGVSDGLQVGVAVNLGDSITIMTMIGSGTHIQTSLTTNRGLNVGVSVGTGDTIQVMVLAGQGVNAMVKVDPNLGLGASHTVVQVGMSNTVKYLKKIFGQEDNKEGSAQDGGVGANASNIQSRAQDGANSLNNFGKSESERNSGNNRMRREADSLPSEVGLRANAESELSVSASQGSGFQHRLGSDMASSLRNGISEEHTSELNKYASGASGVEVNALKEAESKEKDVAKKDDRSAFLEGVGDKLNEHVKHMFKNIGVNAFSSVHTGLLVQVGLGTVNVAVNVRHTQNVQLNSDGNPTVTQDPNVTVQVMFANNINAIYNHGLMQSYIVAIGTNYTFDMDKGALESIKGVVKNQFQTLVSFASILAAVGENIKKTADPTNKGDFSSEKGNYLPSWGGRHKADETFEKAEQARKKGGKEGDDEAAAGKEKAAKEYKDTIKTQFNDRGKFLDKSLEIAGQFLHKLIGNIGESNWIFAGYGSSITIASNRQNLIFSDGYADIRDFSLGAIFGTTDVSGSSLVSMADIVGGIRGTMKNYSPEDFKKNGSGPMSKGGAFINDIVALLTGNLISVAIVKPHSLTIAQLAPNITDMFGQHLSQKETAKTVNSIWDEGRFGNFALESIEITIKTPSLLKTALAVFGFTVEAVDELIGVTEGSDQPIKLYFNPKEYAPDGYIQNYISPVEHLARSIGMESTNFSMGTFYGENVQVGGGDAALSWASAHMTNGVVTALTSLLGGLWSGDGDPFELLKRLPERLGDLFDNQFGEFNFEIGSAGSDDINIVSGDSNTVFSGAGNDINFLMATPLRKENGKWEQSRGNTLFAGAGHDINIMSGQSNMAYLGAGNDFLYSIGDRLLARGDDGDDFIIASVQSGGSIGTGSGNDIVFAIQSYIQSTDEEIAQGANKLAEYSAIDVSMGKGDDIAVVLSNKSINYSSGEGVDMAILIAGETITINLTSGQSFIAAYAPEVIIKYKTTLLSLIEGKFEGGLFTLSGAQDIAHIPSFGHGGIYIGDKENNTFVVAAKDTTLIGGEGEDSFFLRSNIRDDKAKVHKSGLDAGNYIQDKGEKVYGFTGSSTAVRDFKVEEDHLIIEHNTAVKFFRLADSDGLFVYYVGTNGEAQFVPGTESFAIIDGYFNVLNDTARETATAVHLSKTQFSSYDSVQEDMGNWSYDRSVQSLDISSAFLQRDGDYFKFLADEPGGGNVSFNNDLLLTKNAANEEIRFAHLIQDGVLTDYSKSFLDHNTGWLFI